MLPSLTLIARHRRIPRRPALAAAGTLVLAAAALFGPASSEATVPGTASVADTLAPDTWALTIPTAWLATSVAGARPGDRLDVLALRSGDRATATAIAFDLLLLSADERGLIVGCAAEDATAIAVARASGLLIVPLLRSTR